MPFMLEGETTKQPDHKCARKEAPQALLKTKGHCRFQHCCEVEAEGSERDLFVSMPRAPIQKPNDTFGDVYQYLPLSW
jgi:hypothetical protein